MDDPRRKHRQMKKSFFLWIFVLIFLTTYSFHGNQNTYLGFFSIKKIEIIGTKFSETLQNIGTYYSVTRERIRQIENKALRKLKHPSRFKEIKSANTHGTKSGQWSARKAQYLAKKYKAMGGGYY